MKVLNAIPTERQVSIGLLLIRLVLGTIFIAHGAQKVFVYTVAGFGGNLEQMGVPAAGVMGVLVTMAELGGGILLVLGLLTRVGALGIAAVMAGAIGLVHLPNGFFAPNGIEFPLMLGAAAIALVVTGAGEWSLDAILSRRGVPGSGASATTTATRVQRAA